MNCENLILKSSCENLGDEAAESHVADYILRRIRDCAENNNQHFSASITNPVTGEHVNYSDFESISKNVASTLEQEYEFQSGDTLIYSAHDGAYLHVFLLGVWAANGIVRSSYPEDTKGELIERIKESQSKWLLCDAAHAAECLEALRQIPWKVHVIIFGKHVEECIPASDFLFNNKSSDVKCSSIETNINGNSKQESKLPAKHHRTADDICLILPTSGTTGSSKGAIYTHQTIIKALALLEQLPLNDDPASPTLFMGKQTHVSGCLIAFGRITAGHSLLMLNSISTPTIVSVVASHKPRSVFIFPKFLFELIEQQKTCPTEVDLSSIHFAATGGVVVGPALIAAAKSLPNLKAFIVCYGMTECGLFTTNVNWSSNQSHNNNNDVFASPILEFPPYSCGKLVPGTRLMVKPADEINHNDITLSCSEVVPVGPGQLGELYFQSAISFQGYLNKSKETADTLQEGNWIRTGDLGYYDQDGFVFVVDRVKETFKYFNNHISPTEIEQIILRHGAVSETCVVGVEDPDGGDSIARAFVVLKKDKDKERTEFEFEQSAESEEKVAEDIKKFTNNQLPSYKQLKGGLFIIAALPYGKTGKCCRNVLKQYKI